MKQRRSESTSQRGGEDLAGVCPVIAHANQVLERTHSLHQAIGRLRRARQACLDCPLAGECRSLRQLNQAIDAAIDQVTADWGLT